VKDKRDTPLDLVAELLATPADERPDRLAELSKPLLVTLAAAALEGWHRERDARRVRARQAEGTI
jgi:hypothetical protein